MINIWHIICNPESKEMKKNPVFLKSGWFLGVTEIPWSGTPIGRVCLSASRVAAEFMHSSCSRYGT